MKYNRKKRYIFAALIPILILLGMTVIPILTLINGEEVFLEANYFTPRDIFRGQYLDLNYKIEQVDIDKLSDEIIENPEEYEDRQLYGVLKGQNDYHVLDYITTKKPKDKLFLKCRLVSYYQLKNIKNDKKRVNDKVHIEYALDRYFISEDGEFEDIFNSGDYNVVVKMKLYRGRALLVDVIEK
ncbi:GDYXXLXY domain-containing protein [Clostridiisalibacter paucivorans]|uniref:GDYXXLXY domain-containing protein n=1 Tax=Clostridiisalibacter paucivorans TaxID=408753 RepID=UPI00047A6B1B|nr:GDYXXLXY domain-containing protein [Clostridiisalibacter paucivorans]